MLRACAPFAVSPSDSSVIGASRLKRRSDNQSSRANGKSEKNVCSEIDAEGTLDAPNVETPIGFIQLSSPQNPLPINDASANTFDSSLKAAMAESLRFIHETASNVPSQVSSSLIPLYKPFRIVKAKRYFHVLQAMRRDEYMEVGGRRSVAEKYIYLDQGDEVEEGDANGEGGDLRNATSDPHHRSIARPAATEVSSPSELRKRNVDRPLERGGGKVKSGGGIFSCCRTHCVSSEQGGKKDNSSGSDADVSSAGQRPANAFGDRQNAPFGATLESSMTDSLHEHNNQSHSTVAASASSLHLPQHASKRYAVITYDVDRTVVALDRDHLQVAVNVDNTHMAKTIRKRPGLVKGMMGGVGSGWAAPKYYTKTNHFAVEGMEVKLKRYFSAKCHSEVLGTDAAVHSHRAGQGQGAVDGDNMAFAFSDVAAALVAGARPGWGETVSKVTVKCGDNAIRYEEEINKKADEKNAKSGGSARNGARSNSSQSERTEQPPISSNPAPSSLPMPPLKSIPAGEKGTLACLVPIPWGTCVPTIAPIMEREAKKVAATVGSEPSPPRPPLISCAYILMIKLFVKGCKIRVPVVFDNADGGGHDRAVDGQTTGPSGGSGRGDKANPPAEETTADAKQTRRRRIDTIVHYCSPIVIAQSVDDTNTVGRIGSLTKHVSTGSRRMLGRGRRRGRIPTNTIGDVRVSLYVPPPSAKSDANSHRARRHSANANGSSLALLPCGPVPNDQPRMAAEFVSMPGGRWVTVRGCEKLFWYDGSESELDETSSEGDGDAKSSSFGDGTKMMTLPCSLWRHTIQPLDGNAAAGVVPSSFDTVGTIKSSQTPRRDAALFCNKPLIGNTCVTYCNHPSCWDWDAAKTRAMRRTRRGRCGRNSQGTAGEEKTVDNKGSVWNTHRGFHASSECSVMTEVTHMLRRGEGRAMGCRLTNHHPSASAACAYEDAYTAKTAPFFTGGLAKTHDQKYAATFRKPLCVQLRPLNAVAAQPDCLVASSPSGDHPSTGEEKQRPLTNVAEIKEKMAKNESFVDPLDETFISVSGAM